MNRATAYFLILLGAPLGYVASYFFQPGMFRMFASLGDYVGRAPAILFTGGNFGLAEIEPRFGQSVYLTAWLGIGLGVIVMAILAMIMSSKKPATLRRSRSDK